MTRLAHTVSYCSNVQIEEAWIILISCTCAPPKQKIVKREQLSTLVDALQAQLSSCYILMAAQKQMPNVASSERIRDALEKGHARETQPSVVLSSSLAPNGRCARPDGS